MADSENTITLPETKCAEALLEIAGKLGEVHWLFVASRLAAIAAIDNRDSVNAVDHVMLTGIEALNKAREALEKVRQ